MNRRRFLATTAFALAAAADLARRGLVRAAEPRRLKKGIMWATIGLPGSVRDKMAAVKAAGFDGGEMMSHMDVEEVKAARDETGLAIPSVCGAQHWSKPLSHPDPRIRREGIEALERTLRDAHAYGATSVLLVPAVVNKEVSYDQAWERSQAALREVLPLAAELKVRIAIENVWNHFLLSPLEAARYVDELESPWVGWHFDCGNVLNFGWPEQWIRILGPRICKVHIKEFSRKKRDAEGLWKGFDVRLLEGDNDWPAIMRALDEVRYRDWVITEQGNPRTQEELRDLAGRVDRILAL